MKKVLFISTNDGSDMRINKEILTLSKKAAIYFLGVGSYGEKNYARERCKEFYLIEKKRNTPKAIYDQIQKFRRLKRFHKFNSIHIINEQLMIFFYPWLFNQYVVLDIFDSFFMKKNKPGNKWKFIKKLVYAPVNIIIVTDDNRKLLMADFLTPKLMVLENYPNLYHKPIGKKPEGLTIFYNGTMNNARGTSFLNLLLSNYPDVKIIMAGWCTDDDTKDFSENEYVDFRGVISQNTAAQIAANEASYILCCYEPSNQNNINASPNKIYDAIQTKTPVIINSEVKVSNFVLEHNIGVVLKSFSNYNIDEVYSELVNKKDTFSFKKENVYKYSWENIENKLLVAHSLFE